MVHLFFEDEKSDYKEERSYTEINDAPQKWLGSFVIFCTDQGELIFVSASLGLKEIERLVHSKRYLPLLYYPHIHCEKAYFKGGTKNWKSFGGGYCQKDETCLTVGGRSEDYGKYNREKIDILTKELCEKFAVDSVIIKKDTDIVRVINDWFPL